MGSCSHEHDNALHGVHGHHDIKARLAEAESLCAAVGARLTPLRKEVLELILNASAPMGAYDLLAKIKGQADRPAAPPTVYRTLDFLLEKETLFPTIDFFPVKSQILDMAVIIIFRIRTAKI